MKTVTIDPIIQDEARKLELVQVSTRVLQDVLGASAPLVDASWNQINDQRGRPLLKLEIRDFTGSAEATFTPDELKDDLHLRDRLRWLWGDLLQDRSKKQMEKLKQTVQQLEGD